MPRYTLRRDRYCPPISPSANSITQEIIFATTTRSVVPKEEITYTFRHIFQKRLHVIPVGSKQYDRTKYFHNFDLFLSQDEHPCDTSLG